MHNSLLLASLRACLLAVGLIGCANVLAKVAPLPDPLFRVERLGPSFTPESHPAARTGTKQRFPHHLY